MADAAAADMQRTGFWMPRWAAKALVWSVSAALAIGVPGAGGVHLWYTKQVEAVDTKVGTVSNDVGTLKTAVELLKAAEVRRDKQFDRIEDKIDRLLQQN